MLQAQDYPIPKSSSAMDAYEQHSAIPRSSGPTKTPSSTDTKYSSVGKVQGSSMSSNADDKDTTKSTPIRRSSLGNLLRRTKSTERAAIRKGSKGDTSTAPVPSIAPRLPELPIQAMPHHAVKNIGGHTPHYVFQQVTSISPHQKSMESSKFVTNFNMNEDPYEGVTSITNRGRHSYASSLASNINGPRRLRKRKEPMPFNILIIGARKSGKSSFIQFLQSSFSKKRGQASTIPQDIGTPQSDAGDFIKTYMETDLDGDRIGITLWDSPGLEKAVADLQIREIVSFIESKFEETYAEETKVLRDPSAKDSRIHCTILLLDPNQMNDGTTTKDIASGLTKNMTSSQFRDLDMQVMHALQGKTTVIPVISKADICTTKQMSNLKQAFTSALQNAKLDPLKGLDLDLDYGNSSEEDSDEDSGNVRNQSTRAAQNPFPLSVISPDHYGPDFVGREFPWGHADPYNSKHCDFVRLRELIFSDWRADISLACKEVFYENWRTSRMSVQNGRYSNLSIRGFGMAM